MQKATAKAHSNIAFIKYWGNLDDELRLPVNSSLSMTLDSLYTETSVTWDETFHEDSLLLNGKPQQGPALERVSRHLDQIRRFVGMEQKATVISENNFPMGAGIASSASAFAALTAAAVAAADAEADEKTLSTLARLGSGSASRSIPEGFVLWHAAGSHEESYAESIAPPDHWELIDLIAVVSDQHKAVGSQHGHPTAKTSDLQNARLQGASARLALCRRAIQQKDFASFAEVVEYDSNLMHAVMMTSRPPLFYWEPATLTIMQHVRSWREDYGLSVCYTLDAGPNVHCLCTPDALEKVRNRLEKLSGISEIREARPGPGTTLVRIAE